MAMIIRSLILSILVVLSPHLFDRAISPSVAAEAMIVSSDGVQIRDRPAGSVIARISKGKLVALDTVQGDWTKVDYQGADGSLTSGWIASRFLVNIDEHLGRAPTPRSSRPEATAPSASAGAVPPRLGVRPMPPQCTDTHTTPGGAQYCLSSRVTSFDCIESYGGGFNSCSARVTMDIFTNYNGSALPNVEVRCRVEVAFVMSGGGTDIRDEARSWTLNPFSGFGSDAMTIEIMSPGYSSNKATSARVSASRCRIDSVFP